MQYVAMKLKDLSAGDRFAINNRSHRDYVVLKHNSTVKVPEGFVYVCNSSHSPDTITPLNENLTVYLKNSNHELAPVKEWNLILLIGKVRIGRIERSELGTWNVFYNKMSTCFAKKGDAIKHLTDRLPEECVKLVQFKKYGEPYVGVRDKV